MTVLRTIGYGLPEELHAHVKTVTPTTYFDLSRTLGQTLRPPSDGEAESVEKEASAGVVRMQPPSGPDDVVPSFLRDLYEMEAYVPRAPVGKNRLGIVGFLEEYPSPVDLFMFMNEFGSDMNDATYDVVPVAGGGYVPSNLARRRAKTFTTLLP